MSAQSDIDKPLERLILLMNMTTATVDGEALNAVRAANAHLKRHFGGDWERLLRGKVTIMADPFANLTAAPPSNRHAAPPPVTPTPRPAPTPRPSPSPRPTYPPRRENSYAGVCWKCGQFNAPKTATLGQDASGAWKIECLPGNCQSAQQAKKSKPSASQLKDALGF